MNVDNLFQKDALVRQSQVGQNFYGENGNR